MGCFSSSYGEGKKDLTLKDVSELRKVFTLLEEKIQELEESLVPSESFKSYEENYFLFRESLSESKSLSSQKQKSLLKEASIILQGDIHTSDSSQINTIETLSLMKQKEDTNLTLVIEWVNRESQKVLDLYLGGKINSSELKKKIDFDKNWGFCWKCYLSILEYCKKNDVKVLAAESFEKGNLSLQKRDETLARLVKENKKKENKFLVVYGEYHMAKGHIDSEFEKLGLKVDMTIFQKPDRLYFDSLLKTKSFIRSHFLQMGEGVFLQSSKERIISDLQNYLRYLAILIDEEEYVEDFLDDLKISREKKGCSSLLKMFI